MKTTDIHIRLTEEEKEILKTQAEKAGLPLGTYLRNLGLYYPIKSATDGQAVMSLNKTAGDLGRLGGLFKMWLTSNKKQSFSATIGTRSYQTIEQLVDDIEAHQKELMSITKQIIKGDLL